MARTFSGTDDAGLHFLGMRYGHATWVDALGRRTPVQSRFERGAIRLVVSEAVLVNARYPAVLDPLVGPELSFGDTTAVPESDSFTGGVMAFNGVDYVIFWNESRRIRAGNAYAARITLDGGITAGVEISARDVTPSSAEFDGQNLLVAFDDGPDTAIAHATAASLQPGPLAVVANGKAAHLTRMGSRVLMVSGSSVLKAVVIEADGGTSAPDGGPLVPNTTRACCSSRDVDVAFSGGSASLLVWVDGRNDTGDIYGQLVDLQGSPASTAFVIAADPGEQRGVEVSGGGGVFLVTWQDRSNNSVWAALVTEAGVPQAPQQLGNIATNRYSATSTFDGSNFIVAWTQDNADRLRAARISPSGLMLEPGVRVAGDCFPEGPLAITSDGSGHSLVGYWGNILTLEAKRLTGAQPDDAAALHFNLAAQSQYETGMASNDVGQTLLGWTTNRYGIEGVLLNIDGGAPTPLSLEPTDDARDGVNIASHGPAFWATWSTYGSTVGRLVFPDAGLGLKTVLSTGTAGTSAAATARDPAGFLTVWSDRSISPAGVFARRTLLDGGLGPQFEVSPGGGLTDKTGVGVAVNDAGIALVVWAHTTGVLRAVRVSGEQTLDAPPLQLRADKYFSNASVGSDGRDFLVAWEHAQSGGALLGTFVPADGAWDGGDFFLDPPPSSATHPAVHWDGRRYLVVFETRAVDPRTDVWLRAVNLDGGVEAPHRVTAGVDTEAFGVVSSPSPGYLWAAWSAFDPALQSMRVHAQLTSPEPVITSAPDAGQTDGGTVNEGQPKRTLEVGCGCGALESSWLGLTALLVWCARRRHRTATASSVIAAQVAHTHHRSPA